MQRSQEVTAGEITLNGWIVIALDHSARSSIGIAGLIVPGYIQSEMNKVWENVGYGRAGGGPETPPTAVTPAEGQPPTEPPRRSSDSAQ